MVRRHGYSPAHAKIRGRLLQNIAHRIPFDTALGLGHSFVGCLRIVSLNSFFLGACCESVCLLARSFYLFFFPIACSLLDIGHLRLLGLLLSLNLGRIYIKLVSTRTPEPRTLRSLYAGLSISEFR